MNFAKLIRIELVKYLLEKATRLADQCKVPVKVEMEEPQFFLHDKLTFLKVSSVSGVSRGMVSRGKMDFTEVCYPYNKQFLAQHFPRRILFVKVRKGWISEAG